MGAGAICVHTHKWSNITPSVDGLTLEPWQCTGGCKKLAPTKLTDLHMVQGDVGEGDIAICVDFEPCVLTLEQLQGVGHPGCQVPDMHINFGVPPRLRPNLQVLPATHMA